MFWNYLEKSVNQSPLRFDSLLIPLALACFAEILISPSSMARTIYPINNGFEVPNLASGFLYEPCGVECCGVGWTFVGSVGTLGTGIAANGSAFGVSRAQNGNSDGTTSIVGQAAFFQGGDGTLASGVYFYQTIDGFHAGTVRVAFLLESRVGFPMNELVVQLDDTVLGTFSTSSTSAFMLETTVPIPVTPGSHTLYFIPNGLNDNLRNGFVDSVRLDNEPSP